MLLKNKACVITGGSIRSVGDILSAAIASVRIITIPPAFLTKMADHKYTRETVRQFVSDAQKATEQILEKVKR
jgi:transaldolase